MTKGNELVWVKLPCGMRVGSPVVPRPGRFQGMRNRFRKTIKRILEF